jgi:hypothetical protein
MRLLSIFLLLVGSLAAQTPTQVKPFYGAGRFTYQITLDQPTQPGQAIVLDIYAAGAEWQPGPVCALAQGFCDYNLSDSQGNQFAPTNRDYPQLVYIPASKGGPETITVAYVNCCYNLSAVVMVFPVTLVLQDVVPSRCDFIPQSGQNSICNPRVTSNSIVGTDDSVTLSSLPLVSSVPNELFIGFGQYGSYLPQTFSPAIGWSAPTFGGEVFLSYATVGPVGTRETFTLFASPGLLEGQYAYLGINGFKVIPIQ